MTPFRLTALSFTTAMLLASATAQAQSTVNISGLIDLGVYRGFDERVRASTFLR